MKYLLIALMAISLMASSVLVYAEGQGEDMRPQAAPVGKNFVAPTAHMLNDMGTNVGQTLKATPDAPQSLLQLQGLGRQRAIDVQNR